LKRRVETAKGAGARHCQVQLTKGISHRKSQITVAHRRLRVPLKPETPKNARLTRASAARGARSSGSVRFGR